jgi:hypothetical protein
MRIDPFLVFLSWGPVSIVTDNPKGFRNWGLALLVLFCVGLWFALFPRGELTGPSACVVLVLAVMLYIIFGFIHLLKND